MSHEVLDRCIAVLVVVLLGSCSRRAAERRAPIPADPPSSGHQFDWKLRITGPTYRARDLAISQSSGEIPIGFDRWRCEYSIERDPEATAPRDESGYLTCVLASTGVRMETLAVCMETEAKTSDLGTSTLRVSDGSGQLHSVELSCKSKSIDWGPAIVELPVGAPAPARPNVGAEAVAADDSKPVSPQERPPGKAVRVRDDNGALHFQWKIEVNDPARTPHTVSADGTSGALDTRIGGWSCSYQIAQQQDPTFPQLEIGRVSCKSSHGDQADMVMVCAENPQRPSACNMSSLVLTDDARMRHTFIMSCKGTTSACNL